MISIIGIGFVGNAMLETFNKKRNITIYDKYKKIGNLQDALNCDIIFLALPTPFNNNGYELSAIHEVLSDLAGSDKLIILKSTVLPGTCKELANLYNIKLIHNPEFLTARTANIDFANTEHIVIGTTNNINNNDIEIIKQIYTDYFPTAKWSIADSSETELMKLACNSFYAIKVQFFTELYLLSEKIDCSFNKIKNMMLNNNWINPQHTIIPGPDGKISYGGLCFPKDTNALNQFMKILNIPNNILDATIKERNNMRND